MTGPFEINGIMKSKLMMLRYNVLTTCEMTKENLEADTTVDKLAAYLAVY